MHGKMIIGALTACLLVLCVTSSASALTFGLDTGAAAAEMTQVKASGATVFRFPLDERQTAGGANWSVYNEIFERAWEHGITLEPVLIRSFEVTNSQGEKEYPTPFPTSGEFPEWDAWVKNVIGQYGPTGAFWSNKANPLPVTSWEVWNEPDLPENNPGGKVDGAAYGQFLVSTSTAIKSVQPGASILIGGLYLPLHNYREFLEKASTAAGESSAYTGVAIHPYAFWGKVPEMTELIYAARSAVNATGGSGRPLVVNEVGWPVENHNLATEEKEEVEGERPKGTAIHPVGEPEQAELLKKAFDWVKAHAEEVGISSLYWYNTRDDNLGLKWDHSCGLRREDGSYRSAWTAFQDETGVPHVNPAPPIVQTSSASGVGAAKASLNGTINANGLPTTYHFEYGVTTGYGSSAPVPDGEAGSSTSVVSVSVPISVAPATTYHYRIVASNTLGTSYGNDMSFRTPDLQYMLGTSNGGGLGAWDPMISTVTRPSQAAVGDWNGDGKADLITTEATSSSSYRIMLGTSNGAGMGTRTRIGTVSGGSGTPAAIGVGDWNGDGKADLVALETTSSSSYRIMLGTSNGSGLGSWGQIGNVTGVSGPPAAAAVGDWNGDGKADLVALETTSSSSYRIMLGTSNGAGLGTWNQIGNITGVSGTPARIGVGDWNGDGKADLITTETTSSSSYRIMLGTSNGSGLGSWGQIGNVTGVSGLPARIGVKDWNGDGKADLVALETTSSSSYRIMLGTSNGSGLGSWGQIGNVTGVVGPPVAAAVGDWNGDGKGDLVAVEGTGGVNSYRVMLGTSNGSGLGTWGQIGSIIGVSAAPASVGAGDWNGDGKADLVALETTSSSSYRIMLGTSNGAGLGTWSQIGTVTGVSGPPAAAAVGDWNGDGKADLIVLETTSASSYRIMLGTSNGAGLGTWNQIGTVTGVSGPPAAAAVGDWNGDGKADLIALETTNSSSYRIMLGTSNGSGLGTWSQIGNITGVSGPPSSIGVRDWNGDGKADLITTESTSASSYRIMLGTSNGAGLGTWNQIGNVTGVSGPPAAAAVGDWNGDGKADLVALETTSSSSYRIMLGTSNGAGLGTWGQIGTVTGVVGPPVAAALGDWNGDGKADLVAAQGV